MRYAVSVATAIAAISASGMECRAAEIRGSSRIDAVTVFPQGAEVTRASKVRLEPGDHTVLFTDLPAQTIASSIRVEGKATGRLEIGSVDTRRTFISRDDAAALQGERKRLEDEIEKLKDERALLQVAVQAAEAQKSLISNMTQLPNHPAPAGSGGVQPVDWSQLLGLIGQRMAEAQRVVLETQVRIREQDRRIVDLEKRLAAIAPGQQERTEVKVFVSAGSALEADLVIRYQVPGAAWTPFYDARLATGTKTSPPKLQLVRRASIQQRTGEAWQEVALSLSTTRPSAGSTAPELASMTVDFEPDAPPPQPARPVASAPAAGMTAPRSASRAAASADEAASGEPVKARADAVAVGATIEAGAFQALYGIPGRVTVPATGEAKRVQIDEAQLDPALLVRTVPKREEKAYLYAKLVLPRGTPMLPGQVALFRDGTFVGNGRLPQLAPAEEHELGFGADDSVKVRHAILEEKRGEGGIISSSRTDARNYKITVKNLHERAIPVIVLDQLPVSQNQDIKVDLVAKTAPSKRDPEDKRGVMAWEMKLEPDEERTIEFGYRVSWPGAKRIRYGN